MLLLGEGGTVKNHTIDLINGNEIERREVFGDGNDRKSGDGNWELHDPLEER
jgi:hypothetical protein